MKNSPIKIGLLSVLVAGCQSGVYKLDTNESEPSASRLPYRIVEHLDRDKYSEDFLPVEVSVKKRSDSDSSAGLCCLTLGIIPAFYDDYEEMTVTVRTPIGERSGTGRVHAKKWIGWICLIPYPESGDERNDNPKLPNEILEEKLKNQLVELLVSKFSKDEYTGFVRSVKAERAKEAKRVGEKCAELERYVQKGEFEKALVGCNEEIRQGKDNAPWMRIQKLTIKAIEANVSSIETNRLIVLFGNVNDKEMRETIVVHLAALGAANYLPDEELLKILEGAQTDKVRIGSVSGIKRSQSLLHVLKGKYSDDVIIATLKRFKDSSAIRQEVWKGGVGKQMASC